MEAGQAYRGGGYRGSSRQDLGRHFFAIGEAVSDSDWGGFEKRLASLVAPYQT